MDKVIASGRYLGNHLTVEAVKDGNSIKLLVDGLEIQDIQKDFNEQMKDAPAIGGTFRPEANTLLAAFAVLEQGFFEKLDNIEVQGELEEIPYEENQIY